jgi:hypothetical protein
MNDFIKFDELVEKDTLRQVILREYKYKPVGKKLLTREPFQLSNRFLDETYWTLGYRLC